MARRLVPLAALCVMAGAVLVAADFWEEKPFLSWSDKDVQKMLNDSPWADEVAVALPPRLPAAQEAGGRGGRGGGGGGDFGAAPTRVRLIVSWRSALPVKQALVRGQVGEGGEPSAQNEEFLALDEPFYIVAVAGVPMQFGGTALEAIKAESVLEFSDRSPIPANDVIFQKGQGGLLLLVAFPRTNPVTLEDRDVEFVTKLGDFGIKKKFRLRDMVFQGDLEL